MEDDDFMDVFRRDDDRDSDDISLPANRATKAAATKKAAAKKAPAKRVAKKAVPLVSPGVSLDVASFTID